MSIQRALISMGYRNMQGNRWGKPVADHLFFIEVDGETLNFANYFKSLKGEIMVWSTEKDIGRFSHTLVEAIKYVERYTRTDLNLPSDFAFITPKELTELMLGC